LLLCEDKVHVRHKASKTFVSLDIERSGPWPPPGQQGSFISNGGWATMPGNDEANSAVAEACATMLGSLTK
jgi:hypothetical protein